jgi:hypothetical protein
VDVPAVGAVLESGGRAYRVAEVRTHEAGGPPVLFLEALKPVVAAPATAHARGPVAHARRWNG